MKLRNGHIDTITMMRLLLKHYNDPIPWTASAPETDNYRSVKAEIVYVGGMVVRFTWQEGTTCGALPNTEDCVLRWDWRIHRPKRIK